VWQHQHLCQEVWIGQAQRVSGEVEVSNTGETGLETASLLPPILWCVKRHTHTDTHTQVIRQKFGGSLPGNMARVLV